MDRRQARGQVRARVRERTRRGAAVVEMAIAGSMLVILLLVTIDMAQYITINQVVSNASRAAARHAARDSTANASTIEQTAQDYLEQSIPSVSSSTISGALTVEVRDSDDAVLTGTINDDLASGDAVTVEVQFDFDAARWLSATSLLQNRTITATTTMRRE